MNKEKFETIQINNVAKQLKNTEISIDTNV